MTKDFLYTVRILPTASLLFFFVSYLLKWETLISHSGIRTDIQITDTSSITGSLAVYKRDAALSSLEFVNMYSDLSYFLPHPREATCGHGPCFVSLDQTGTVAFAANYCAGTISVHPILPDGGVGPASYSRAHTGRLLPELADRQECAHPHAIRIDPYVNKVLPVQFYLSIIYFFTSIIYLFSI